MHLAEVNVVVGGSGDGGDDDESAGGGRGGRMRTRSKKSEGVKEEVVD